MSHRPTPARSADYRVSERARRVRDGVRRVERTFKVSTRITPSTTSSTFNR